MKLSLISFQNFNKERSCPFSEIYEQSFSDESNEKYVQAVKAMLTLIRHLENEIEAPEHWICFSHGDLMFYNKDIEIFNSSFSDARKLQVGICEREPDAYQIGNRTTSNVKIAGEWVRCALEAEI